jgi:DNA-directed RNA polymerase specialized sigma24 family protein
METFESLYGRTFEDARRLAQGITRNREMAEDAVQKAAEYVVTNKPEGVTKSYWLQLVTSRAKDALRSKRTREREVPSGSMVELAGVEDDTIRRLTKKR